MLKGKNIDLFFFLLMSLVVTLCISLLFWASNKGFDITDEGAYLYLYSDIDRSKLFVSSFHLIQDFIFSFFGTSIIDLRIERILLSVLISLFFSFSFYHFCKRKLLMNQTSFFLISVLSIVGIFLSYTCGPQTPSYNFFSLFFMLGIMGLYFFEHAYKLNKLLRLLIYFSSGALFSILFLIKFPNALLLLLLLIIHDVFALIKSVDSNWKSIVSNWLLLFFSFIIFQIIFWKGLNQFNLFLSDFYLLITEYKTHDNKVLLSVYWNSIIDTFVYFFTEKYFFLSFSIAGLLFAIHKNKIIWTSLFLLLHAIIVWKYKFYQGGAINVSEQMLVYLVWIVLLFAYSLIVTNRWDFLTRLKTIKTDYSWMVLLFILPFIGSLGTLNPLQIQIAFYMPFWFLLIYFLVERLFSSHLRVVIYTLIVFLGASQVSTAVVINTYRLNTDLCSQNQPLSIRNNTIMVDSGFSSGVKDIEQILKSAGIKENDPVFAYSDHIGLAYIYEKILPTRDNCWFDVNAENSVLSILSKYFHKKNKEENIYFILDKRHLFNANFKSKLKEYGCDFDKDYKIIGEVNAHFTNERQQIIVFGPNTIK